MVHRFDEETEKRGLVGVAFHVGGMEINKVMTVDMAKMAGQAANAVPVKFASMQNCFVSGFPKQQRMYQVVQLFLKLLPKEIQARNKFHFGASIKSH